MTGHRNFEPLLLGLAFSAKSTPTLTYHVSFGVQLWKSRREGLSRILPLMGRPPTLARSIHLNVPVDALHDESGAAEQFQNRWIDKAP